jgi:hypothetical protein
MKRILMICGLMIVHFISFGQNQKEPLATPYAVPVDTITRLITYEGVVEVKGVAAGELYKRISDWFHSYYKNPAEVIREDDSIKFVMVGKPRFRLTNISEKDGSKTEGAAVQYTITVSARDGRFKYELTEFNWKQLSYYPSEKWMDTKATSYQPIYNDYLQQLDKNALETIQSLKNAVTRVKPVKNKDNW